MIRVRFTKFGATTAFGEFGPGTIARVSEALAAHYVKDLGIAEYVEAPAPVAAPAELIESRQFTAEEIVKIPPRKGKLK